MKTFKAITIRLLLCALIIAWGWREKTWHSRLVAECERIESIEEVQIKVGAKPDGIVGKETITKWNYVLSRQIGDKITEQCWTKTGKPKE